MNEHDATEIAYKNGYAKGKIDAVWEMAERLHKRFGTDPNRVHSYYDTHRYIDEIARKITEDA